MADPRFLVTGGSGCIGSWVLRNLVLEGIDCWSLSRNKNLSRLRLILDEDGVHRINWVVGSVADYELVEQTIRENNITHIIHLAALQLPFCKANPPLGAQVNVVGTVNIFEAAKRSGINHIAYASTTAVYGLSEEYPEGVISEESPLRPRSHYGVYKQANEGTALVYWLDDGISSLGLRPYVAYGPGRDQGMTSTPTTAMLAAAAGRPYKVSYGGRFVFQYADDIAKTFIKAACASSMGADAYNIGGPSVSMSEIIEVIEHVSPQAHGLITYEEVQLPFPTEIDNSALVEVLGSLPQTTLRQGISETLHVFETALKDGRITWHS